MADIKYNERWFVGLLHSVFAIQFNWMDYKPLIKNEYLPQNWPRLPEPIDPYELLMRGRPVPELQL